MSMGGDGWSGSLLMVRAWAGDSEILIRCGETPQPRFFTSLRRSRSGAEVKELATRLVQDPTTPVILRKVAEHVVQHVP